MLSYKIPVNGEWFQFTHKELTDWETSNPKKFRFLKWRLMDMEKNGIAYVLPHGRKYTAEEQIIADGAARLPPCEYDPEKYKNDGEAFLSEREIDIQMLVALSQGGKTYCGAAWSILHLIPTDPDWVIFKENGVEYHEWEGPKEWVVASYSWSNVQTLWDTYRTLLPRDEIGVYAPGWGKYEGEEGQAKNKSFGDGRAKILELKCGSKIRFLCYSQPLAAWEGFYSDGAHFDEQVPKDKFISWSRSTQTRGDSTACCFTLTGYTLPDRPNDTGAVGWVCQEMYKRKNTRGLNVRRYHIGMDDIPDAIVSPNKKKQRFDEWANPDIKRTERDKKAAIARYYGCWEEGSGSIFDDFNRLVHVIEPLWDDDKVPRDYTLWRSIDYGGSDITCCLWFAVSPEGRIFCYRSYYEPNVRISESCKMIVQMSNNELVNDGMVEDPENNTIYCAFKEKIGATKGEIYYNTLLDKRSAHTTQNGSTLEELFAHNGIEITPACAQHDKIQIPRLKELLRINYDIPHVCLKDSEGRAIMGSPNLYFFAGRTEDVIDEIESCAKDPKDKNKVSKKSKVHAIDCSKYFASDEPQYFGDMVNEHKNAPENDNKEYLPEEHIWVERDTNNNKNMPYSNY